MVSSNKAGFNLREIGPLPRYILHTWRHAPGLRGSDRIQWYRHFQRMTEDGQAHVPSQRMPRVNWFYPLVGRDTAKSGMGCFENRHLHDLVESIAMNVGGPYAERCSPAMNHMGVGAAIVVGARESRVQGEGPQGIDVRIDE
jgi:hypothetical protein